MKWSKQGLIFAPENVSPWMKSHAANPVAMQLEGSLFRIYFSCRDEQNRAHIGYVDVDLRYPRKIVRVAPQPVLTPGEVGTFDDSGVSLAYLVKAGEKIHLYYLGWNLGVTVPWRNSVGLAISLSGTDFVRQSKAPVLDRHEVDPYSVSYPCVLKEGAEWKMWYGSNLAWGPKQEDMEHVLKYATSSDGIHWDRTGKIVFPLREGTEIAHSKPCVLRRGNGYQMWYSYRGSKYRIGYAESADGLNWTRKDDEAGIGVSPAGWDSEAVCYPFVFDYEGTRYLLYNGNRYGLTGFGLATLESE